MLCIFQKNPGILFRNGTSQHKQCRESRATHFLHRHGSLADHLSLTSKCLISGLRCNAGIVY